MVDQFGEQQGTTLLRRYADAFPEAYKEDFPARVAAADVRRLEEIGDAPIGLSLYAPVDAAENEMRFKVFREHAPLSLSQVLPVLTALGTEVTDERPYEVRRRSRTGEAGDDGRAWIYDFGLRYTGAVRENARELFQDAFMAVWSGRAESDGFSALVLRAGLTWRQVTVLRAYAKYFRQGGSTFGQDYLEQALVANIDIAQLLVALFERRFDPAGEIDEDARAEACEEIEDRIEEALDDVASLDQDRILRGIPVGHQGDPANELLPDRDRRWTEDIHLVEARAARGPGPARSRGRCSRSSCTRRASRACTSGSGRSPAAACAGPTAATTSVPRSSAWSRRRWSRTR